MDLQPAVTAHPLHCRQLQLSLLPHFSEWPAQHTQAFAMAMSFEDVDVEAVAELSAEEVDEREVFEQEEKEQVEGVLDFFLGGGLSKVEMSYRPSFIFSLMV